MKSVMRLLLALCPILLFLSLSPPMPAFAADSVFVDLDGDGFDDMAEDSDNDGIPDLAEKRPPPQIIAVDNPGASFFAGLTAQAVVEEHLSVLQRFKLREFAVRDINSCRSDLNRAFDADSGPGTNLSGGGSRCVGGICF
ncbi:MAG: hypothetical protein RBT76_03950 [candidate division Zixibacteria bacterium]|nr:hypothetical protein [candidate division Zixibacteria bacterium]